MLTLASLPWRSVEPTLPKREDEKLIAAYSTHWIKYVRPMAISVIFFIVSMGFLTFAGTHVVAASILRKTSFLIGLLCITYVHHRLFRSILSESMEDVMITDKRFIYLQAKLWSDDEVHEVSLDRIKAVEARKRGLLQNVLRYGSLWFDTGGSDVNECIIPLIPHPDRQANAIRSLLYKKVD